MLEKLRKMYCVICDVWIATDAKVHSMLIGTERKYHTTDVPKEEKCDVRHISAECRKEPVTNVSVRRASERKLCCTSTLGGLPYEVRHSSVVRREQAVDSTTLRAAQRKP